MSALTISLLVALEDGLSVSEPLLSSFLRKTLEYFVPVQSWRIQYGLFGKKPVRLVIYHVLNTGVVFGVVFPKKCSQIGKKPPQNRLHCFGSMPAIIIVSDVSELSTKPCHPPFTPATGVQIPLGQKSHLFISNINKWMHGYPEHQTQLLIHPYPAS